MPVCQNGLISANTGSAIPFSLPTVPGQTPRIVRSSRYFLASLCSMHGVVTLLYRTAQANRSDVEAHYSGCVLELQSDLLLGLDNLHGCSTGLCGHCIPKDTTVNTPAGT